MTYRSYLPERMAELKRGLTAWMNISCAIMEAAAKKNLWWGHGRATGDTAKSIRRFIDFPNSTVVVNTPYARFVEGHPITTRKHFVPFGRYDSFDRWVQRKPELRPYYMAWFERLAKNSAAVAGIWTWGYKIPFMQDALNYTEPIARAAAQRLRIW